MMVPSRLVLGTAAFDDTYASVTGVGFDDARKLVVDAARHSIGWFDTAPAYGAAEAILGQCITWRPECRVGTKVRGDISVKDVRASLANSRIALGQNTLSLVQLHNATQAQLAGPVFSELKDQQDHGYIDLIGASVYEEDEALAAIAAGCNIVQVPFNLIDQRMAKWVFPVAAEAGVGIWARSVWLRGLLAQDSVLRDGTEDRHTAAESVRHHMLCKDYTQLADVALRFVLAFDAVTGIVIGPRTQAELHAAVDAEERGRLGFVRRILATVLPDFPPTIYDPRKWV